ncbi:hypothetical protein CC79DRAFT_1364675 [Sarocladium strictum]
MCKNNNTHTFVLTQPECDSKVDLDYPSFFQALALFICIIVFQLTTNEYVQATYTNILNQFQSVQELFAIVQTPLRLAIHSFASQIYATVLVFPRTAFQKGISSLAEACSKSVSHLLSHAPLTIQQNSGIAHNKVASTFTLCSSVLEIYFSAINSYLHGLVSDGGVLHPYLGIVASYFSVPYTKASLFISNAWSSLKIRQIVIRLPFQIGKLEYLTVLGSQTCTKDTSLKDVTISMIRALYNSLAATFLKTTFFLCQLTILDYIKIIFFLGYLVLAVACLKYGQRFFDKIVWFCLTLVLTLLEGGDSKRALIFCLRMLWGHRTGLPRELRRTLYLVYFPRACKWLSTTAPRLSRTISRVARFIQAFLQDTSPIHLISYIYTAGQYASAWFQDRSPFRLSGYISRLGQQPKAWLKSPSTGPAFKLLLFSTMAFILDFIVEPLRRRIMGGYPTRPWPPISAIRSLFSHIALLPLGLVQDTKAWFKSLCTTPDFKPLLASMMAFVFDIIVEPLRRRVMGRYPTRPWPPTSAIGSLVSHISLVLVGLIQDIKMKIRHFACMLRTTWQYLSPTFPGGLHYGLRLTIASTVADIIDVLITLVCLAVFLAIALGYQVILFTMAVRLLEQMFSVSVFNQVDH